MNTSAHTHERFRIGNLELDSGTFTLRRGGEQISLPQLSFELLLCLARHAPNVVSTEVLMDEVWGDVVVGEETVKQRVKLLRKALGDSGSDPRYILAVRGRGYRLLPEVSEQTGEFEVQAEGRGKWGTPKAALIALAVLAVVAVGSLVVMQDEAERGATNSPEALEAYHKGRAAYRRWTPQDNEAALAFYQRAVELDPDFALAIAGAANANALRATQFGLGDEWIDEAIGLARRALELEPELPEALKALGICHVYQGRYQIALDYYRNALRIDPEYDEVLFNVAEIMHTLGRWDEAVEYQQRDTDRPQGKERLSIYLRDLDFDEQAEALVRKFENDLPVSYFSDENRSLHHLLDGNPEQARRAARRMQRAIPNTAGGWLREGEIDLVAGDLESAANHFDTALKAAGALRDYSSLRVAQLELHQGNAEAAESLIRASRDSALQAIDEGHEGWFHRWNLALGHALEGNRNKALEWFERSVDAGRRRYEWDEIEPVFESIREYARFESALQRQRDLRREMKDHVDGKLKR